MDPGTAGGLRPVRTGAGGAAELTDPAPAGPAGLEGTELARRSGGVSARAVPGRSRLGEGGRSLCLTSGRTESAPRPLVCAEGLIEPISIPGAPSSSSSPSVNAGSAGPTGRRDGSGGGPSRPGRADGRTETGGCDRVSPGKGKLGSGGGRGRSLGDPGETPIPGSSDWGPGWMGRELSSGNAGRAESSPAKRSGNAEGE